MIYSNAFAHCEYACSFFVFTVLNALSACSEHNIQLLLSISRIDLALYPSKLKTTA